MSLVVGLITLGAGILVIPGNAMSARRLTHAERVAAVETGGHERIENNVSVIPHVGKLQQLTLVVSQPVSGAMDPRTALLFLVTTAASLRQVYSQPRGNLRSSMLVFLKSSSGAPSEACCVVDFQPSRSTRTAPASLPATPSPMSNCPAHNLSQQPTQPVTQSRRP